MKKISLIGLSLLLSFTVLAQDGSVSIRPIFDEEYVSRNLCGAVTNLAADAAKGFVKAKGKEIETVGDVAMWTSNMGLPGTITSSLLFSKSWQYEGVLYHGASTDEWKPIYEQYKKLLKDCLLGRGYDEESEKNLTDGLSSHPELVYKRPAGDAASVTLKIDRAATTGMYTLTINVWQGSR